MNAQFVDHPAGQLIQSLRCKANACQLPCIGHTNKNRTSVRIGKGGNSFISAVVDLLLEFQMQAFRFTNHVWHFTDFNVAHSHMTMYGIITFILLGRYIEARSRQDASSALRALAAELRAALAPVAPRAPFRSDLGRDLAAQRDYSEEVAEEIDAEVHKLVDTAHARVRKLLSENLTLLHGVANALLERETLNAEEFEELFAVA